MVKREKKLQIIIINWNSSAHIANCISSLMECCESEGFYITVVDNSSPDFLEINRLTKICRIDQLIELKSNLGFSGGNLKGFKPGFDFYLMLNPDVVFLKDSIKACFEIFNKNSNIGIASVCHLNSDGTEQASYFSKPNPWQFVFNNIKLSSICKDNKGDNEIDWVCGSFLMVKREVIEKIGFLDPSYFLNNEDIDFCLRVRESGWEIKIDKNNPIIHKGGSSRESMNNPKFTYMRSNLLFLWKKGYYLICFLYYATGCANLLFTCIKSGFCKKAWGDFTKFLFLKPVKSGI